MVGVIHLLKQLDSTSKSNKIKMEGWTCQNHPFLFFCLTCNMVNSKIVGTTILHIVNARAEMKNKCYIYTRVSTSMQVDGYSLDAQKDRLYKYAEYQELFVAGEYSDEGKSG